MYIGYEGRGQSVSFSFNNRGQSVSFSFNPIRSGLFSRSPGPDAKNHGYHQPIEIKFCVSHYSHNSLPDAKFESGSFSSVGDMTSQNFPLQEGNESSNSGIYPPKMGLTLKK